MPLFPFNPAQYDYRKNFEKMPAGWYPAVISESDIVPTAKNDGFRLVLTYTIIDGPHKGRTVGKQGHNIQNPNPQTVEIAMSEIKTINACIGNYNPINQTEEMHNKPMQIRLTDPKDSDFNEVKGWKTINGDDPGKGGQGAPVGHVPQPPQGYGQAPAQQMPYGPPPTQQAPAYSQQPPAYQQQPQYAQQPPAPMAAPAWAPPAQQAPQQPQAPAYQQQAPQQPAAAPAWTPGAAPAAPAWVPQR